MAYIYICCYKRKNSCHIGVNHSASLCHAAYNNLFSANIKLKCHFFYKSICCYNSRCGVSCAVSFVCQIRKCIFNSFNYCVHRHIKADNACCRRKNLFFFNTEAVGKGFCHKLVISYALCSRAGVGIAAYGSYASYFFACLCYFFIP